MARKKNTKNLRGDTPEYDFPVTYPPQALIKFGLFSLDFKLDIETMQANMILTDQKSGKVFTASEVQFTEEEE